MNQVQMQMPTLSKTNKILMITTGVLFLLESLLSRGAGFSLTSILGLSAKGLGDGLVFQLVTYPLVEKQLLAVIFNGLLLWFLGSELETQWGRKRYLQFIGAATLTAGIVYVLIGLTFLSHTAVSSFPLSGLQGIGAALCVAYGILYPDHDDLSNEGQVVLCPISRYGIVYRIFLADGGACLGTPRGHGRGLWHVDLVY